MDPKILAQIAFSVATWKFSHDRVFDLHHRFLLQHAVIFRDLFPVLLLRFRRDRVSLVTTVFFSSAYSFCRDISFFSSLTICLAKFVVLTVLCRDNLMCGSLNSYVATSISFVVTEFLCNFFKLVSRPVFMSRQHLCFGSCYNNVSCIVGIFVTTQTVYRNRVLSPLNLISCCSFILMLRHGLLL